MKRDSNERERHPTDVLMMRTFAALVSLGMILPEYLLLLVFGVFLATTVLTIVQTITPRDASPQMEAPPVGS